VVQGGGFAVEYLQVVLRIETLFVLAVAARMPGDHLTGGHHLDMVHVAFDRHGLKRYPARDAVAVVVEAHGLVLVHLTRLVDAGIERERR
jgi:hypothetical protein